MIEFNFIMFPALLGIVSFQKLNSGGFYIGLIISPSKMSEVLDTFDPNVNPSLFKVSF